MLLTHVLRLRHRKETKLSDEEMDRRAHLMNKWSRLFIAMNNSQPTTNLFSLLHNLALIKIMLKLLY